MNDQLPTHLRAARGLLDELGSDDPSPTAGRALDRLERDLLPRTAAADPYLVIGIVGPNNAGKSALFNALVGAPLSPSLPTGGATRRLMGAAHPELLERLAAEPTLARFRIERCAAEPALEALDLAEDPAEVRVAEVRSLPRELLLIDTPDFDSILEENRRASESLLAVADLAVVVVTRHSYQNREVVRYLERWLAHGRPWMLFYNEAPDRETTRQHARKLAQDLGSQPAAVFWQRFDLNVQDAGASLSPRRLGLEGEVPDTPLADYLFDLEEVGRIKASALEASLAQFREDLESLAAELGGEAANAAELLDAARGRSRDLAREVASQAMPARPFLEAFQAVLDRRGKPWNRGLRGSVRGVGLRLGNLAKRLRPGRRVDEDTPVEARLARIEGAELAARWPGFWEGLARDLGPEGRVAARGRAGPGVLAALDADLDVARRENARAAAASALDAARDFEDFERRCEELVDAALDERGYDWDMQLAADLVTLAPLGVAALVIVKTGGLGADLGVAGGGALSAVLTERLSRLLGAPITREARQGWTDLRTEQLRDLLLVACLPKAHTLLEGLERERARIAEDLTGIAARL